MEVYGTSNFYGATNFLDTSATNSIITGDLVVGVSSSSTMEVYAGVSFLGQVSAGGQTGITTSFSIGGTTLSFQDGILYSIT
jgi:hypothetical protein